MPKSAANRGASELATRPASRSTRTDCGEVVRACDAAAGLAKVSTEPAKRPTTGHVTLNTPLEEAATKRVTAPLMLEFSRGSCAADLDSADLWSNESDRFLAEPVARWKSRALPAVAQKYTPPFQRARVPDAKSSRNNPGTQACTLTSSMYQPSRETEVSLVARKRNFAVCPA